ncbi:MAG TPA: nuclease-related domain-containing protein [Methylibium sp.]|nr:nuclease-related domain-containing protein [Methylibium sp.]
MSAVVQSLLLAVAALALVFSGPLAAYWFLMRRKRAARAERRSPLTRNLLRAPGQQLREQLDDRMTDMAADLAALMVVPPMVVAFLWIDAAWRGRSPSPGVLGVVGVALVGVIGVTIVHMRRRSAEMDRLRLGVDAELAVGQELDQLMRRGAVVFHDLPGEGFNIDHVVVASQGVFAVETKGYSKRSSLPGKAAARVEFNGQCLRFPHRQTSAPLEQSQRQAQWLSRWLSQATGDAVAVTPVLALPGWFVDRKGVGTVRVYSGLELAKLLDARGGSRGLGPAELQRIAHQLEQRCRNVKPSYRDEESPRAA